MTPRGRVGPEEPPRLHLLLTDPGAGLPRPDPGRVQETVTDYVQRLREALDAGTPEVIDGLISRWADQWLAGAERDRLAALARLTVARAAAVGEARRARERLARLRARRALRARELGSLAPAEAGHDAPDPENPDPDDTDSHTESEDS